METVFCIGYQEKGTSLKQLPYILCQKLSLIQGCACTCSHNSTATAELKLFTVFLFFSSAMALSLILFTIGLRRADEYQQAFDQYFQCEALGYNPQNPCALQVDRSSTIALSIASYSTFVYQPYVAFVYIIPFKKVKNMLRTC